MKIYTRTGDAGETGLFAGGRVAKDDVRIEAYGDIDELNAVLGLARAESLPDEIDALVERIQHDLFSLGAELATPNPEAHGTKLVSNADVQRLEQQIDRWDGELPALRYFVLPGGTKASATLHMARCVCRRAERRVVTMQRSGLAVSPQVLGYLNRLSDLLFVLARASNHAAGVADVAWRKPEGGR